MIYLWYDEKCVVLVLFYLYTNIGKHLMKIVGYNHTKSPRFMACQGISVYLGLGDPNLAPNLKNVEITRYIRIPYHKFSFKVYIKVFIFKVKMSSF